VDLDVSSFAGCFLPETAGKSDELEEMVEGADPNAVASSHRAFTCIRMSSPARIAEADRSAPDEGPDCLQPAGCGPRE